MKYDHNFIPNQKVRVKSITRADTTCAGMCSKCGQVIADEGDEGFVCELTEFLFEPVVVVHFIEKNKRIGFRPNELEILEDFNPETGEWFAPGEAPAAV